MERRIKGFTLIEMLAVLAILGVLLSIAVPAVGKWLKSASIKQDTLQLYSFIQKARFVSYTGRIYTQLYKKNDNMICLQCQNTDTYCKSMYPGDIECFQSNNTVILNNRIGISKVGYFEKKDSIFINDTGNVARFNCIAISLIRVRLGKNNNGTCQVQ